METWWLIDYVDSGGTIRSSTPLPPPPPPTTDVSVPTLTTSEPIRGPPIVSADLPNEEDQRNYKFSTTTNVGGTEEEKKNELATVPTNKHLASQIGRNSVTVIGGSDLHGTSSLTQLPRMRPTSSGKKTIQFVETAFSNNKQRVSVSRTEMVRCGQIPVSSNSSCERPCPSGVPCQ